MNYFLFILSFILLSSLLLYFSKKYKLLNDQSTVSVKKAYSYSRVQLTWWSFIILVSFITVLLITGRIPTLNNSTLILLGISILTTATATVTDVSDSQNQPLLTEAAVNKQSVTDDSGVTVKSVQQTAVYSPSDKPVLVRNLESEGFFLDILSDRNGVSIHRLQSVIFNLVIGIWFIWEVLSQISTLSAQNALSLLDAYDPDTHALLSYKFFRVDQVLPEISKNNLILLGMSSGTYVALKTQENK